MDIVKIISEELNLNENQISSAINLLDQGASVPFIARYRKEATNNMKDSELRYTEQRLEALRQLEIRKQAVYKAIDEQGKITSEISEALENAKTIREVEDIYRPFKIKKDTRVEKALKAHLDKLAQYIYNDRTGDLENEAKKYICEEFKDAESCIKGACDVIAGNISDNTNYRVNIKRLAKRNAVLKAKLVKNPASHLYDIYDNFEALISKVPAYRALAINRGCKEKCLKKEILLDDETNKSEIAYFEIKKSNPYKELLKECVEDAYKRLIKPSIENDLFSDLMEKSEDYSIEKFKINLKQVLLEAPVKNKVIMGFDPGLRTGCKLAILSPQGDVLQTDVSKITHKGTALNEAVDQLINLIERYHVDIIALGNGTGGREAEEVLVKKVLPHVPYCSYVFVSESGASIYSASDIARNEFPNYDVTIRGAISIGRRLLDPLSELVKIPPESIGVGQYQHDLNQTKLKKALKGEIEDAVNYVGVDLNIASSYILTYISGLSKSLAESICDYRKQHGAFNNREELLSVKGFGSKAYENCAGFLRIDGDNPLDNTGIHPESYEVAHKILNKFNIVDIKQAKDVLSNLHESDIEKLSKELNIGVLTLNDIIKELIKPTRDPRTEIRKARLLKNVNDITKVKPGMVLEGTVRNITDFGAFIDIGVHCEGLLHKSQISDKFVKDVNDFLKIGDIVKVYVISVEPESKSIKLSTKMVKDLPLTVDVKNQSQEQEEQTEETLEN